MGFNSGFKGLIIMSILNLLLVYTAFIIIIRHELILIEPENCNVLGYFSASSGNFLLTFQDPSRFRGSRSQKIPRMLQIDCSETSVRNYHFCLPNNTEQCKFLATQRLKPEIILNRHVSAFQKSFNSSLSIWSTPEHYYWNLLVVHSCYSSQPVCFVSSQFLVNSIYCQLLETLFIPFVVKKSVSRCSY